MSKNCIGTGGRTDIYGSSYGGGSTLIPWQIFLLKKKKKKNCITRESNDQEIDPLFFFKGDYEPKYLQIQLKDELQ